MPAAGVAPKNRTRVLINLHGGGFQIGSRTFSHLESIPIASVGKIKVISVDYRMAPEHRFPAASEDVAALYRDLLKTYQPHDIGMYGCSAGGLLTAQVIVWLQKEELPLPGAVGMFCAAAGGYWFGDSATFGAALAGSSVSTPQQQAYFQDVDEKDPLFLPIRYPALMAKFPPSLLITSTRDGALSSVVHTHSVLIEQGVPAELYVWEGLDHAFFYDPDLPQSRQAYDIIANFFDKHLRK